VITQVGIRFKNYWVKWVKKRNRLGNPQTLHSRNLYILPSGFGWAYGLVVVTLLFGSINYQISTMFLMTFILAIIGLISAWEAHANLKNLAFQFIAVEDAQQGTPAKITLLIQATNKIRFGVDFQIASQPKIRLEKIPLEGLQFIVPIETATRGFFPLPAVIISGLFPFGIFKVWSYAYFEEHYYYVYPQAKDPGFWPEPCLDKNLQKKYALGDEEFYDLKQVENPWTEPNRIAWKIAAKGQGWYLKTMDSSEVDYWLFKLNDLPSKDFELNLQNLSYWVQAAELNGMIYGLELRGSQTPFARGKEHLQHCLRQLALCQ
jgi:uncharacterized protein (DUF58 family)